MMSQQQNDQITQVSPGTPAGAVLRRYWIPAALSAELEGDRAVVPIHLMGEQLVLFRDGNGDLGLFDRRCPHRGADLCFGRLEQEGLRCPFHGWQFAPSGQCIEQPAEPPTSTMYKNVKARAYPVVEKNGIVFAYMGPGEPPAFPAFDCFEAPDTHVFAFKGKWECNWLQALEVGIDPAHASFLHRFLQDEDPAESYGKQFRDKAPDSDVAMTKVLRDYDCPTLRIEQTDFGMRIFALRDLPDGMRHVRVTNHVFPCAITIPMSSEMNITQWHVPIDDENCYWYAMFTSYTEAIDKPKMRAQRLKEHTLPEYAPIRNRSNDYGYDVHEQNTLTYTGMGLDINVHDQWACESMGNVQDRTQEHLASTDIAIVANRRALRAAMKSVAAGNDEQLLMHGNPEEVAKITGPIAIDAMTLAFNWKTAWIDRDNERRAASPWKARQTP